MKKDAYYFPHFCNARSDRKIKRLKKDLGIEGYGIYFMTLEVLREQTDFKYPLTDVDLLADEFGTSEAKLTAVISKYELFEVDLENNFFSPKLMLYLQPYIEKSERARIAAQTRWNKVKKDANAYANALPEHCESESKGNANQNTSKGKENKEKKSKIKDEYTEQIADRLYSTYPKKQGRQLTGIAKEVLNDIDEAVLLKCIELYKKDIITEKREKKYIKQFSAFFGKEGGTYRDYIGIALGKEEVAEETKYKARDDDRDIFGTDY